MGEKIEFQDGEVPDKNPNPKNELYTKDGHSLKDDIIIGVLCFDVNMCEKYYCRKRVLAFGTPCVGLIIESSAYQASMEGVYAIK